MEIPLAWRSLSPEEQERTTNELLGRIKNLILDGKTVNMLWELNKGIMELPEENGFKNYAPSGEIAITITMQKA